MDFFCKRENKSMSLGTRFVWSGFVFQQVDKLLHQVLPLGICHLAEWRFWRSSMHFLSLDSSHLTIN
jgi:hypothetical protein